MHVVIATPNFARQVDGDVAQSMQSVACNLRRHGHEVPEPVQYSFLYIDKGRNDIAKAALEMGADVVFYWDADQTIYLNLDDDFAAMMNLGPIVTGAYLSRHQPANYVLWNRVTGGAWKVMPRASLAGVTEPFEVHRCGAGCLWVRREVFEKIGFPYFLSGYHSKGDFVGEDFHFCERAHAAGYKIIVQPKLPTGHIMSGLLVHRAGEALPPDVDLEQARRIHVGDGAIKEFERLTPKEVVK
jgi:hypothetical protein